MIFQHSRFKIFNISQHPYRHGLADISYSSPAFGSEVVNAQQALDWITAVLYPNTKDSVADQAALNALVGNTLNDYRVVLDDGDGKQAGYRWEQREGEANPSWHKIYDFDWSTDAILAAFLDITQDQYVIKAGRMDYDGSGSPLAGDLAGQHVYGGTDANSHLSFHANSGDGVGANTGYIQFEDDIRPMVGESVSSGTTSERWVTSWTDTTVAGTLTLTDGSITDSSGAIDFGDETLETSSSITAGTLLLSSGSITDTSGLIDFGDEDLTTTGTVTANDVQATGSASSFASGTTVGNLTLSNGSIIDSSGAISFGDENLTTTGTLSAGDSDVTRLDADNIRLDGNTISILDVNGGLNLLANGTGVIDLGSDATSLDIAATGDLSATNRVTGTVDVIGGLVQLITNEVRTTSDDLVLAPFTGDIIAEGNLIPDPDATNDLGDATLRWNRLFLSNSIGDGTDTIVMSTLLSFRDANVGANNGDTLFWNNAAQKWEANHPDTEIDHGELAGIGDDDHAQYVLLAGRAGEQVVHGGAAAGESLTLDSTSDANKGAIIIRSLLRPDVDDTTDLGIGSRRWKDLFMSGEGIGFRVENATNFGALPAASASNPGRLAYTLDNDNLYIDDGGTWRKANAETHYEEDAVSWDGVTSSKSYTVAVDDTRKMVWQFKDNANSYKILVGAEITHTSATNVTVSFGINLPAGTYTLVGR